MNISINGADYLVQPCTQEFFNLIFMHIPTPLYTILTTNSI